MLVTVAIENDKNFEVATVSGPLNIFFLRVKDLARAIYIYFDEFPNEYDTPFYSLELKDNMAIYTSYCVEIDKNIATLSVNHDNMVYQMEYDLEDFLDIIDESADAFLLELFNFVD